MKVQGFPKTSGSEGLHIYIPLPPGTPYEAGMLFCQIIATMVASKHPKVATVERMVRRRKDGTVYVDYLQNIQGKTLACAYSARGSAFAGVSTPLTWKEVHERPKPQDFTIDTIQTRVKKVGDLWAKMREPQRHRPARRDRPAAEIATGVRVACRVTLLLDAIAEIFHRVADRALHLADPLLHSTHRSIGGALVAQAVVAGGVAD